MFINYSIVWISEIKSGGQRKLPAASCTLLLTMLIDSHRRAISSSGLRTETIKTSEVKRAMNLKDYVSPTRAAQIRGVKLSRIIAMVNDGLLKRFEYDGGYLLKRSEVENYVPKTGGRRPKNSKKKNTRNAARVIEQ